MINPPPPLLERLMDGIRGPWADPEVGEADCWLWTRSWRSRFGYGRLREGGHNSRQLVAHRAFYELTVGPIPFDRIAGHRCNQPLCCNPDHIYPATYADNYRDQLEAGQPPLYQRGRGAA